MKIKTVSKSITIDGIGLHSGKNSIIGLVPSSCGYIYFSDKNNRSKQLKALFDNVVDTNLGTTIANNELKVLTIEHLMAALWACDIGSLEIVIDGNEMPILSGNAYSFIEKINKSGVREIEIEKKYLFIKKEIIVSDNDKFIKISPSNSFTVDMTIEYNYGSIGKQNFLFDGSKDVFIRDISKAKTFCRKKDIDYMLSIGLAKGGSLENALVFDDDKVINEDKLTYNDEVVRHKLLDFIGDVYTSGYDIVAKIEAYKNGHTLNNILIRKIFDDKENYIINT